MSERDRNMGSESQINDVNEIKLLNRLDYMAFYFISFLARPFMEKSFRNSAMLLSSNIRSE